MNNLKLTREPLDVGRICEMASSEACEAISIFVGRAQDYLERKKVIALEYEAIEPMALKQLDLICTELRNQWQEIINIVIYHRLGLVDIGEASVVIAISSPDSETSLNAVAVAVSDLKKQMPICHKVQFTIEQSLEEKKKCGINLFNENMCLVDNTTPDLSQLTQISVSEEEIERRIQCFIEKKRNEIDLCNILDFTDIRPEQIVHGTNEENVESESMMCARINSSVIKQEYSKCHLKVKKVVNNIGPQTRSNYLDTLDKLMIPIKKNDSEHGKTGRQVTSQSTTMERLQNIEEHLLIQPSQITNIHQRLKFIEDRLIFLESISPEYSHFLVEKCFTKKTSTPNAMLDYEKKTYSTNQIDMILQKFK